MTAAVGPANVTVRLQQSMRHLSAAVLALAAQMPAAAAAMAAFVTTLRAHLPADATPAVPDAIAADGRRCYHVTIWHDLLWYCHAKSAGVTSSGFTREGVLRDVQEQIARLADLPGPDAVALTTLPG